jgi:hypothetical protein
MASALGRGRTMANVFDTLPGMKVPLSSSLQTLASMWDVKSEKGLSAPSAYRASQMNLVLHFGFDVTPDQAKEEFETVLRFAQRYPCRILVLCPGETDKDSETVDTKIFSECYIGKSRQEMSCCEVIIVSYTLSQRTFLENQVAILMESDLPLFYHPYKMHSAERFGDYQFFLEEARRIIIDSKVENKGVLEFKWPRAEAISDLVYARLLPVRQSIGQFLSAFAPLQLIDGLVSIEVISQSDFMAESRVLIQWMENKLADCGDSEKSFECSAVESTEGKLSIAIKWNYKDDRYFSWSADLVLGCARIEADFGNGPVALTSAIQLLPSEKALAEALFF